MISSLSVRSMYALVVCALLATGGCTPQAPPSSPLGRTEAPLWHVARYAVDGPLLIDRNLVFAVARSYYGSRVYAFDSSNGDLRWMSRFVADRILGIAGPCIYVEEFGSKRDHALDTSTGDERPFASHVGLGPFEASGDVLYTIARGRELLALTRRGDTIWQRYVGTIVDADGPPPIRAAGTVVVFGSAGERAYSLRKGFYAFDAATGVRRWKRETISSVAFRGGYNAAHIVTDGRFIYADRVTQAREGSTDIMVALDPETGAERWHRARSANCADGAMPISPGRILACLSGSPGGGQFVPDGLYAVIDGATGNVLRRIHTGMLYHDDIVRDGSLFVSGASPYKLLNEGGSIAYYRWLSRVDVCTGKELWRGPTETAVEFTTPVANDGLVVVGSRKSMEANEYPPRSDVDGLWAWRYDTAAAP